MRSASRGPGITMDAIYDSDEIPAVGQERLMQPDGMDPA